MKIFVLGYSGFGNVGDDAIVIALVKSLDKCLRFGATVYIYVRSEYITNNFNVSHNIKVIPVHSPLAVLISFLKARIILICGGDHLHDFGAKLKIVKVFTFFFALGILAKFGFKKFVLINGGIRVRNCWSAGLMRAFLRLVTNASFRDTPSYFLAKKLGLKHAILGFDTAVLLNDFFRFKISNTHNTDQSGLINMGISITPVYSNFFCKPALDDTLAKSIALSLNQVLKEFENVRIYLLCFNNNLRAGDMPIIKKILSNISPDVIKRVKILEYKGVLKVFLFAFSNLDIIVGCKYHSLLFSYMFDKPTIVINYHPKNTAFACEVKLKYTSVVSLEDVKSEVFAEKIRALLSTPWMFKANYPIQKAKRRALVGIKRCVI